MRRQIRLLFIGATRSVDRQDCPDVLRKTLCLLSTERLRGAGNGESKLAERVTAVGVVLFDNKLEYRVISVDRFFCLDDHLIGLVSFWQDGPTPTRTLGIVIDGAGRTPFSVGCRVAS